MNRELKKSRQSGSYTRSSNRSRQLEREDGKDMRLRTLAEAIILQSMEDIWNSSHRKQSIEFFNGEGFDICAKMAGMNHSERNRFRKILSGYDPCLECFN